MSESILQQIEKACSGNTDLSFNDKKKLCEKFLTALESGQIRCAKKTNDIWGVDKRVKQGILLCFQVGEKEKITLGPLSFIDKSNIFPRKIDLSDNVRIVPGGASVRRGAFLGKNVTMMPPSYVNIGAFVGDDSMIDSNALVGSCAQIGKGVHLSAGAQIGGVLEPIGALPVIIEDRVLIGGCSGIFEGTIVQEGAVIGAGVILTKSTKVFDLVNEKIICADEQGILTIPKNAVLVPGSRPVNSDFGKENKLSVTSPLIIKYRDKKTESKARLEESLR